MFIGHFAVGFGAKKVASGVSLGVLFIAAQFLDLLWPSLLLLGIEQVEIEPGITKATPLNFTHYPISHSLVMVLGWGIAFGAVYWLIRRKFSIALVLFLCVVSHWVLDVFVHRPDLPLYPGDSPLWGVGLWNYPLITLFLEGLIFLVGIFMYAKSTTAKNKIGRYGFFGLAAFLAIVHLTNIFGPPPPSVEAIAWAGQLQWIFVLVAFWVDKNRIPT